MSISYTCPVQFGFTKESQKTVYINGRRCCESKLSRKFANTRSTKDFVGFFAVHERLQTSATLLVADKWVVTAAHCIQEQHGSACLPGFRPKNCCEEDDMSVVIGEHNLHDDNRNDPIRYKLNLSELFTLFFKESSGD